LCGKWARLRELWLPLPQTAAKDNRRKRKEFVRQLEEEVRRSNARNVVLQCKLDTLEQENK